MQTCAAERLPLTPCSAAFPSLVHLASIGRPSSMVVVGFENAVCGRARRKTALALSNFGKSVVGPTLSLGDRAPVVL
jgi:hypothetical protein